MNDTQNISLDLFRNFLEICNKLNLKWYMINGSALGAVKYGGFIPWDDDIDVGMPRKDYEIFLKEAQSLLPEHIFLQNYRTDKYFPHIFSKLRNSNTTFIERSIKHLNMNHGMYIDIFPLDNYPDDPETQKTFNRKKKVLVWKCVCNIKNNLSFKVKLRNCFVKLLGYGKRTHKSLAHLEKLISAFPENSKTFCNHGDRMRKKQCVSKEIYGNGCEMMFEGIKVNIPEKYDEYLTHKYGNWRADPPKEQQNSHHHTTICDPKKPYSEYIEF
ncbi:MAG: LicD family protein [Ruminococcaceae bacterium]|nr:LicD family protein [Oscillospiraceae bacterium]